MNIYHLQNVLQIHSEINVPLKFVFGPTCTHQHRTHQFLNIWRVFQSSFSWRKNPDAIVAICVFRFIFSCLFVFPNVFVYHRFCNGCQLPSNGWEELIQASWTEKPAASKIDKAASTWDWFSSVRWGWWWGLMTIGDDQNRRNLLHRLHLPVVDQNNWVAGHKAGLGSWTEHWHLDEKVTNKKTSRESPPCWHPALSSPPHPSCDG